jgi:dUTP pyrophosphatase
MNYTTKEGIEYVPTKGSDGAAAYDLRAAERKRLDPHKIVLVPTGISVAVPDSYSLLLFLRSGLGAKGIMLANGVGVIDPDYRGEIFVALINQTNMVRVIEPGDRIAQAMLVKSEPIEWDWVEVLDETDRGSGSFGSTGK